MRSARPRLWLGAAALVVAAIIVLGASGALRPAARASASLLSIRLHFPLLPHGGARPVAWPRPTGLPTRTGPPTPRPRPSPTATASATPVRPIAFQSFNRGGLPAPPYFQMHIARVPWIRIYEDGQYLRANDLFRQDLVAGRLEDEALAELLDRIEDEGGFFDYPSEDRIGRCATDGNTTTSTLRREGREHTVASYMMLWLGLHPDFCPPGSPGMPAGPETERFLRLARVLASLNAPLTEDERPLRVEHAIVYAEAWDEGPAAAPWPLDRSIEDARGHDTLRPDEYAILLAAIRENRVDWTEYALFRDAEITAAVGVEVLLDP